MVSPGHQRRSASCSPSGSKVLKTGERGRYVEPPKLEDLTRPVCRRPLRVLGLFGTVEVVLDRFGMGLTSVRKTASSNSESSESPKGVNLPSSGDLTSNWVRDLWRGRRAPVFKVRVGRVVLLWEGRRLAGLGIASNFRPST